MSAEDWAFLVVGVAGSIAAIRLVTSQNVVHAALYLVVTLAIVVLLLFSLMLTRAPIGRETLDNQQRVVAALVGAGVLAGLVFLIQDAFSGVKVDLEPTRTAQVGTALFRDFVLPFEVVSVLLLAALVGAIVIARKEEGPAEPPERSEEHTSELQSPY